MKTQVMPRFLALALIAVMLLSIAMIAPASVHATTPSPNPNENVVQIEEGTSSYSLFNSGGTSSDGYNNSLSYNPAPETHDNYGYDLYGAIADTSTRRFRLGMSFVINDPITEQATLSIKAYDVDEDRRDCGYGYEHDFIYLVDETDGTSVQLDGHMSGQNNTWNNTSFKIRPELFQTGHTYHFELNMTCTGSHNCTYYCVVVRTVALQISSAKAEEVVDADVSGSISSDGEVFVTVSASTFEPGEYTIEYKAVHAGTGQQRGGRQYTFTITENEQEYTVSFELEYGSPSGAYIITVFIKDSYGNVVSTREFVVSVDAYSVSYNANGGTQNLPLDTLSYLAGDTVTVLFDYVPSHASLIFAGWSTDKYATVPEFTPNGVNSFVIGESDVVLYAVWQSPHTHTYDHDCDEECNDCGETREVSHDYAAAWSADANKHWHECAVCGTKADKAEHDYTDIDDPTCNECGFNREENQAEEDPWFNGNDHWHETSDLARQKDLNLVLIISVAANVLSLGTAIVSLIIAMKRKK